MLPQTNAPAEQNFHCQQCGECCTSWRIPIERDKTQALLERPWVQERLNRFGLTIDPLTEGGPTSGPLDRLPLREDQYCVFLDETNRCLIEVNEGHAAKPEQCKRFPFARSQGPDGTIYTETSGYCKSIAEAYWPNLTEATPGPRDAPFTPEALPETIRRHGRQTLSFEDYLKHHAHLNQALFQSPQPAEAALRELAHTWAGILPHVKGDKAFQFNSHWHQWIPVLFLRHPYGLYSRAAMLQEGTYGDIRLFGFAFSLKGHRKIHWPQETLDPLARFFLLQFLKRKVPLSYGHSMASQFLAATVSYFLLIWYAKTYALLQERAVVAQEDALLAIRTLERYYSGHQPEFLEQFRSTWWVEPLLKRIYS